VVGASLYTLFINFWSLLIESDIPLIKVLISSAPTSVNTTRKALDNIDIDIDIEDPLFVSKRA
jgi:hypothetical protein